MRIDDHGGLRVQYLDVEGPMISTREDTSHLIGNAWVDNVTVIALPIDRLDPAFFDLSSGIAGDITQKMVNYGLKLAIIGDISATIAVSQPFADYVWETNRGDHIWFFAEEAGLVEKLAGRTGR